MGKANNSYLAGVSGRVGNVVLVERNGEQIIRKLPAKSTKPRTPKQNATTQRFVIATKFINSYKSFAKNHYGKPLGLKSCYNQAMSSVLKAIHCDPDTLALTIRYSQIQFAKGKVLVTLPTAITFKQPNTIQIDWINNATLPTQNHDTLLILIAAEANLNHDTWFIETQTTRASLTHSITLPNTFQNQTLHLWLAFKTPNTNQTSNSEYLGTILATT